MEFTINQIAEFLNGTVEGDGTIKIVNLAKIEEGEPGTLTFLANPKYAPFIYTTNASAVVINKDFVLTDTINATLIRVDDAYLSFTKLLDKFSNVKKSKKRSISKKACIDKSAKIGKNVSISEFVSIGENVIIGDNTTIHPNVTIYGNVKIGSDTLIYSNVSIMDDCVVGDNCIIHAGVALGADGFGFAPTETGDYVKIPQTGNVVIEDNVEIGANTTIDRATIGATTIRKGVKIDNLVQIGHNCDIGSHTVVVGQTGISGSTSIGQYCMIGGQTGIAGHLKIGNKVKVGAKTGIMHNLPDESIQMGVPSFDARQFKKSHIHFRRLDELVQRINELEKLAKKQ